MGKLIPWVSMELQAEEVKNSLVATIARTLPSLVATAFASSDVDGTLHGWAFFGTDAIVVRSLTGRMSQPLKTGGCTVGHDYTGRVGNILAAEGYTLVVIRPMGDCRR